MNNDNPHEEERNRLRRVFAVGALPMAVAIAAAGIASAAPGQPGFSAPAPSQPGTTAQPPAPEPAPEPQYSEPVDEGVSYLGAVPEAPAVPTRPLPTYMGGDDSGDSESYTAQPAIYDEPETGAPQRSAPFEPKAETTEPEPEETTQVPPALAGPTAFEAPENKIRIGSQVLDQGVVGDRDARIINGYASFAEYNLNRGFDSLGFSREKSDRTAAATLGGAASGAFTGAWVGGLGSLPLQVVGCGVGGAIGALAGGAITAPTVVGVPAGAVIGGLVGCGIGAPVVGVAAAGAGAVIGGLIGGGSAAALASGEGGSPDAPPPLIDPPAPTPAPAPADAAPVPAPAVTQAAAVLDQAPPPVQQAVSQWVEPVQEAVSQWVPQAQPQVQQAAAVVEQNVVALPPSPVTDVAETAVSSFKDAVAQLPTVPTGQFGAAGDQLGAGIAALQGAVAGA